MGLTQWAMGLLMQDISQSARTHQSFFAHYKSVSVEDTARYQIIKDVSCSQTWPNRRQSQHEFLFGSYLIPPLFLAKCQEILP